MVPSSTWIPLGRLVGVFFVVSMVTVAVVGLGTLVLLRPKLLEHEIRRARSVVSEQAHQTVEPAITAGLLDGDPAAFAEFDRIVRREATRSDTARLTLWTDEGIIVYSLDEALVGYQHPLPPGGEETLLVESATAALAGLEGPGEVVEAVGDSAPAIEVYTLLRGPEGERLLWEVDLRRDGVTDHASELLTAVAVSGAVVAGLVLSGQGILGWTIARRHERERQYRSWLLHRVSDGTLDERRRFASDLHDGVVQDLTGIALDLELPRDEPGTRAGSGADPDRSEIAGRVRAVSTALRQHAAEISPADLSRADLRSALSILLDRVDGATVTRLEIDPGVEVPSDYRWLVHRVAQEALQNVRVHADASVVVVSLRRIGSKLELSIDDDGVGFEPRVAAIEPGHLGLALLADMVAASGASLTIRSSPGNGTTVRLEVPG